MRTIIILTSALALIAAGCSIMPTSFIVTSRISNRGDYEGTNFAAVIPNPFVRRVVKVEYVTCEGGSTQEDCP